MSGWVIAGVVIGELLVASIAAGCIVHFCYYKEYRQRQRRYKHINNTKKKVKNANKDKKASPFSHPDYGAPLDPENGIFDVNMRGLKNLGSKDIIEDLSTWTKSLELDQSIFDNKQGNGNECDFTTPVTDFNKSLNEGAYNNGYENEGAYNNGYENDETNEIPDDHQDLNRQNIYFIQTE